MNFYYFIIFIVPTFVLSQANWEVYNSENSPLPYNQVNDLSLDLENNLVIGTEYGAAKLTNNQTWEVFFDEGEGMGLSSNIIKYIDTDLNNNIWACSPDGISIIHTDYTYSYLNMNNTDLPSNFTKSLFFENENRTWIGTTSGLILIEDENWNIFDFLGLTNITSNHITKIIKHPTSETIFFGTLNGGLVTYNNEFTFFNNDNSQLLDNTIRDLYFDENENLIMTTTFAGLGVWTNTNSWVWFNSQTNPSLPFFINSLGDLIIDNSNNIWLTTIESGLIKYSNNNWTFYNSENSSLPEDEINCIAYDDINNQLWIGTQSSGIASMNLNSITISESTLNNLLNIKNRNFQTNLLIESTRNINIEIINYYGAVVKKINLQKGLNNIYMKNLNSGLYFIYTPELNNNLYQIVKI